MLWGTALGEFGEGDEFAGDAPSHADHEGTGDSTVVPVARFQLMLMGYVGS